MDLYSLISNLQERIATLESRVLHVTKPSQFTTDANTKGAVHTIQAQTYGNTGELHEVNVIGQYGFASVPLSGALGHTLSSTGRNDNKIVIATHDPRYHPQGMKAGETQIYDNQGQSIYLSQDAIQITGKQKVTITIGSDLVFEVDDKTIKITGDVQVSGTLTAQTDVVAAGKSLKSHEHLENGKGSLTSAPQ